MNEKQLMRRSRWLVLTLMAAALALLAPTVGQAAGAPAIAFTPSTNGSFDYGTVAPGQTGSQTFTVRNSGGSGTGALTIALAGSGAFTKTADTCTGNGLGPGKSCTVIVQYGPTVAGQSDVATLTATGSRPAVRASITLNGAATVGDVAPSVQSTSPADGAADVVTNTNITVNFSEPVTATTSSFSIVCAIYTEGFTLSGSGTSSVTLDPTLELLPGTPCLVTIIANAISDVDTVEPPDHMAADYTFSFTTDSAPYWTSTTPVHGATDVDPASNITFNFDEPVDVTASSFTITCDGALLPFAISGSGTSSITLDPDSNLPTPAECYVTAVAANISDVDTSDPPDHPTANLNIVFFTQDVAPSVQSTSPADGAIQVAVNANIVVNFSEPVAATTSSFTLECPTGAPQSFTVSGSPGSAITLDPAADLPEGTICSVTVIANQISDIDTFDPPDQMAANYAFSFATASGPTSRHIYWTNVNVGTIGRADLDGQNADQNFITGATGPWGVAVDSGHVYWTNRDTGTIGRADLDGQNVNQSFISASDPVGIAVDAGHVYWTNAGYGTIGRADLDGQNANQSFISGASGPVGLAVDAGHVYWTNNSSDTIGRADLDGQSASQNFITGASLPWGVAVDSGHVYWTNSLFGSDTIGRADLDGQNPNQSFINGALGPAGMAVDSGHLYWGSLNTQTIGRADLDGQNANQSFITGASGPTGVAVDSGGGTVVSRDFYWTNSSADTIGRADVDGSNPNQAFIAGASAPGGLAVDNSHIYWTNFNIGTIGHADLDGSNANQSFITGASAPVGLAVDSGHIYWVNRGTDSIARADLDGQNVNLSFITGAHLPQGLAIDSGHIYWTNVDTDAIGRADLDGSNANQSFITGASGPFGLAVDSSHIYWTSVGTDVIGRADLDGSNANQSFITGASGPFGIAVDSGHVYWANGDAGTIGRADLDGQNANQGFITGASSPVGVAVGAG